MLKPQPIFSCFVTCQMHRAHQDVGQALVALVLEMVLGQPQRVEAEAVHRLGDRFELVVDAGELVVVEAPLIGRGRVLPVIGEIDVAGIDGGEFVDHDLVPPGA